MIVQLGWLHKFDATGTAAEMADCFLMLLALIVLLELIGTIWLATFVRWARVTVFIRQLDQ